MWYPFLALFTTSKPKCAILLANEQYRLRADVCCNHQIGIHLITACLICAVCLLLGVLVVM